MGFLAEFVAGTISMFLAGHVAAAIIRKVSGIAKIPSYVIGLSSMTFVGAWLITYDGGPSFWENWIVYVIEGVIALPLMIVTSRRGNDQKHTTTSQPEA